MGAMKFAPALILLTALLAACAPSPAALNDPTITPSNSPNPAPSATATPQPSHTAVPTLTPTAAKPPAPTPTPTWVWQPPGEVVVPILLYHHITDQEELSRYVVSPQQFAQQMAALQDWGYTAIPVSLLLEAITQGAYLPPRPIVITFDDGNLSVFENAFPIMQTYGFPGVTYIVANRLRAEGFTGPEELTAMLAAGWEVGSHGYTHQDLTQAHDVVRHEVLQARLDLQANLGIPILTFAYPFGGFDEYLGQKARNYGYQAAVGLGKSWTHNLGTLYYLSRIEIHGSFDLETFGSLLPWAQPLTP